MSYFSLLFKQGSKQVLLVLSFIFFGFAAMAQGDAGKGQSLFTARCTACHKIDDRLIGPGFRANHSLRN